MSTVDVQVPGSAESPRAHGGIIVLLVPLLLVLFIATVDRTIVATAIPGIGAALRDTASAGAAAVRGDDRGRRGQRRGE